MSFYSNELPTIFHITHRKSGSQWVYNILDAVSPSRVILPQPENNHFSGQPVIPGMIYPTLYLSRDEFTQVSVPDNRRILVTIRDLRDTLVSWYFSFKHSHVDMQLDHFSQIRQQLKDRSLEEGLRLGIHTFLVEVAQMQRSWIDTGFPIYRYEEILNNQVGYFREILKQCEIEVNEHRLAHIVDSFSFEEQSGRARGDENVNSHYRKAVVGDWRNYLKGELLAEIKELYDDLLIMTGYENDRDWGRTEMPSHHSVPLRAIKEQAAQRLVTEGHPRSCWCGSTDLISFSTDYHRCSGCGSLVYRYPVTLEDVYGQGDDVDLYGINYWRWPRYYTHILPGDNLYANALNLEEHARYLVQRSRNLTMLDTVRRYFLPDATVLDIGCGSGALPGLLAQAGYNVSGTELSPTVAAFAGETFGVSVKVGPLEMLSFPPGSVDVLILSYVVEHFPDPEADLRRGMELLSPDGLLIVDFLPFDDARSYRELWATGAMVSAWLRPVEHVHLFPTKALKQLLNKVGCGWIATVSEGRVIAGREELTPLSTLPDTGVFCEALLAMETQRTRALRRREIDRTDAFRQLERIMVTLELTDGHQSDRLHTGEGWYTLERDAEGEIFQWASNDAELIVTRPTGQLTDLEMTIEPGPSLGHDKLALSLHSSNGQTLARWTLLGRQTIDAVLPIESGSKQSFTLHAESENQYIPDDHRLLNFRLYGFGWKAASSEMAMIQLQQAVEDKESIILEYETILQERQKLLEDASEEAAKLRSELRLVTKYNRWSPLYWLHKLHALIK